jgi:hypothetical protein
MPEEGGSAPPTAHTIAGLKVWQALLVYPALLTSLGGALPTAWQAFKAWRLEVNYTEVQQAEAQQRLWERNLDCLEAKPVYSVEGPGGAVIGVTLCPSGDALLRYDTGEDVTYTWIRYPTRRHSQRGPRRAYAQAEPPTPLLRSTIVWGATRCAVRRGTVVIRLFTTDGTICLVEHVLVATGVVVSQVPVSCSLSCVELEGTHASRRRSR